MHNLVELVIGVFVELVQVCFNLLRHIRRRRRGLGPGQNVVKHYVVTVVCCKYFMDTLPFLARVLGGHDFPERLSVFQPAQSLLSVFQPSQTLPAQSLPSVFQPAQTLS